MTTDNHPTAAPLPSGTELFIDLKGLAMQAGSWFDRKDLTLDQREDAVADLIKFAVLGYLKNSAMKKAARPVPEDVAGDVELVRGVIDDHKIAANNGDEYGYWHRLEQALDRIVAHLSQTKSADKIGELVSLLQSAGRGFGTLHNAETDADYAFSSSLKELQKAIGIAMDMQKPLPPQVVAPSGDCWQRIYDACAKANGETGFKLFQQAIDQARAEGLEMVASAFENKSGVMRGKTVAAQIRSLIPAGPQTNGDGK